MPDPTLPVGTRPEPLPVYDAQDLRECLDMLRNSEGGTSRSAQSVGATHKVILAAHELEALLKAAESNHG